MTDEKKTEYIHEVEARLDAWRAEIEQLRGRGGDVAAGQRFQQTAMQLEGKRAKARAYLDRLRGAEDNDWHQLKRAIETACQDVENSLQMASSHY